MVNFYEKYKKYLLPSVLFVFYIFFIITTWGKWGDLISDCFREMIIPQAMIDGNILYSDITCIYPPLAYQLNALLFKIFGNSMNVLYCMGILCSTAVLTLIYTIIKKHSSVFTAFITVLTIMCIFTFRIIQTNFAAWFFPYSYSFLYAFTSCMFGFYFYLLFKDTKRDKYLYISLLMCGISAAFKFDFLLFAILPLIACLKTKSVKNIMICVLSFVLPFISTYLIWFANGGTVEALNQFKDFLINFANAPSVKAFNDNILIQSINAKSLKFATTSLLFFVFDIAQICGILFILILIWKKCSNIFIKWLFISIISLVSYIFIFKNIALSHLFYANLHISMVFLPYLILISALVIFIARFKKKDYNVKEKFYLTITVSAFLISYRMWAAILISYIGNYFIVIYWFAFIYFLTELLPEYITKIRNIQYYRFVSAVLIVYAFTYSSLYFANAESMKDKVTGDKAVFYGGNRTDVINKIIDYTIKNIPEDKTVLCVDEGLVINYYTGRKTNLKYYALIPHIVDTYGEDKIIEDLDKNPPDYIFVTNNVYPFAGFFGQHYAKKIMNYFTNRYECVEIIKGKSGFKTVIMKLKN